MPEKRYRIHRRGDGVVEARVIEADGTTRPLEHLVLHSPDGFEFGYYGSGPADLARSIVGDVVGTRDPHPRGCQRVKARLIATMADPGGEITEGEVRRVLGEGAGRPQAPA